MHMYFCRIYLDIWLNGEKLQHLWGFDQLENLLRSGKEVDMIVVVFVNEYKSQF